MSNVLVVNAVHNHKAKLKRLNTQINYVHDLISGSTDHGTTLGIVSVFVFNNTEKLAHELGIPLNIDFDKLMRQNMPENALNKIMLSLREVQSTLPDMETKND